MLAQVARVEVTVTASETEALLLEYNLIKQHRPRYNILLKDDKSFPYIHLTEHEFPRLAYYRGAGKVPGRFFGPYPNSVAARETLQLLQKLFRLRPCEDTFFANRSRPCLQHQIGRCSAPCVGLVTREAYAQDTADAVQVLQGRNNELIAELGQRMETAAGRLQYEAAAHFRDQIAMLKQIQASQSMTRIRGTDIDAVAIAGTGPEFCVSVVFVRGGRNLGSTNFFPKGGLGGEREALAGFLAQYYLARESPDEIVVSEAVEDGHVLEAALRERAGRPVPIRSGVRGARARWLAMARTNAELGLKMKASSRASVREQLASLQHALGLEHPPQRLECFDVSHTMGESAIASCVVFGAEGPLKADYRRFNLKGITPGDDYAGMRQAVARHFARVQRGEGVMPDVLLIDGGEGQLQAAREALAELGIDGLLTVGSPKERTGAWGRSDCSWPVVTPPYTGPRIFGIAIDPARARRSPPLRDRRAPQGAGAHPPRVVARGDPGARSRPAARIAEVVRRPAGRATGLRRGPREGPRHQSSTGRTDLRKNEPGP